MPVLRPSWQLSVELAVVLVVLALVLRPVDRPWARSAAAFCREFTVVLSLLAVWQYVGRYVHTQVGGAFERARDIAALQRAWHLPSEAWMQRLVLPFPDLVRVVNLYYEYMHLNTMAVFLVWVWVRHREAFGRVRLTVVLTTLACLLVQAVPVAPPRMLTDLGFVDTALLYNQSVYGPFGSGIANQLAAMPSVHVAWAVIVGWYAARLSSSRWRWLGAVHAVITVLVVVLTANHWWLDGVVAVGFMALAVPGQELARSALARVRTGGDVDPSAERLPAASGVSGS
jgi:hypothetical protein